MYREENFAVKRLHRLLMPWRNTLYGVWEKPLLYLRRPYYLNIYFNTHFCITKIQTNQKHLNALYKKGAIPKTLYRIVNAAKHTSLLYLFYQLKFKAPKSSQKVYLQLNNSGIVTIGKIKVLSSRELYCLKLHLISFHNLDAILDQYQNIPSHIKEVGYKLYRDIHRESSVEPIQVAIILKQYPHSRALLYRYFQRVIGTTPSTVWRNRRLLSYAYYLLDSDETINTSYAQFGFSSASHLHRNFKKRFHISPLKFRNKYRNL